MTTACLDMAAASRGQPRLGETFSDEKLIQRIAAGDRLAMQTLFARHRVAVYRWPLRLVNDEALAEDLLSDVFLDVWRQAASFEARPIPMRRVRTARSRCWRPVDVSPGTPRR